MASTLCSLDKMIPLELLSIFRDKSWGGYSDLNKEEKVFFIRLSSQTHLGGRPRNCLNNSFLAEKVNRILHRLHKFDSSDNVLNSEYTLES